MNGTKRYVATMDHHGRSDPINHGLVNITDAGFLDDGTPIEDYGMFIVRDKPLPTGNKLRTMFMKLLARNEGTK